MSGNPHKSLGLSAKESPQNENKPVSRSHPSISKTITPTTRLTTANCGRNRAPSARAKRIFNPQTKWRREIESHARDVGASHTDDLSRWLVVWIWFNKSKDQAGSVINCARRMGRPGLTEAEAEDVILESRAMFRALRPGAMSKDNIADTIGRLLGVDYATRQRLGFTKIGSYDVDRQGRLLLRRERNRQAKERKRREAGARPQSESICREKRWRMRGLSRSQRYRRLAKRREADRQQMIDDYFGDIGPAKGPSKDQVFSVANATIRVQQSLNDAVAAFSLSSRENGLSGSVSGEASFPSSGVGNVPWGVGGTASPPTTQGIRGESVKSKPTTREAGEERHR